MWSANSSWLGCLHPIGWLYLEQQLLTLPMLRLLLSIAQGCKDFWKPSKTCYFGIHWTALAEYSQMSTHLTGFQSFFVFFASLCIDQIRHQQHKGWPLSVQFVILYFSQYFSLKYFFERCCHWRDIDHPPSLANKDTTDTLWNSTKDTSLFTQ